jgi:hypothetical protein
VKKKKKKKSKLFCLYFDFHCSFFFYFFLIYLCLFVFICLFRVEIVKPSFHAPKLVRPVIIPTSNTSTKSRISTAPTNTSHARTASQAVSVPGGSIEDLFKARAKAVFGAK